MVKEGILGDRCYEEKNGDAAVVTREWVEEQRGGGAYTILRLLKKILR